MKQKFKLGQKVWYKTTVDTFMCWKPEEDTITSIILKNDTILYTTSKYDTVELHEHQLYESEQSCKKACINQMKNNIKHIQEHIDTLIK